jgi:cell division protein FtsN
MMIKRVFIALLLSVVLAAVCAAQSNTPNNNQAGAVPTPTSAITPIVPPWETGAVAWPVPWGVEPPKDVPELNGPWIPGIEQTRTGASAQWTAQAAQPVSYAASAPDPVRQEIVVRISSRPWDGTTYRIQVGAFKTRLSAQAAYDRLANAGFRPAFEQHGGLTRVLLPSVRSQDLGPVGQRLYNAGFRELWVREE